MVARKRPKGLEELGKARAVLNKHTNVDAAAAELGIGRDGLYTAFREVGETPAQHLRFDPPPPLPGRVGLNRGLLSSLTKFTSSSPRSLEDVCNHLELHPKAVRELIFSARQDGYNVELVADHVGTRTPPPNDKVQDLIIPPTGARQMVGVISDTHLGSKYCLRKQLRDFIHEAYDRGVREILHPGDVLDGNYRHGIWEVSHSGLDAQAEDLYEVLPRLPGLTYHGITGNHDETLACGSGLDVGRFLENFFKERGRNDLKFYGNRSAFLQLRGAIIQLWHPRSGVSYARSYALQKHIEKYSSGEKPHIMLAGHWHIFCHVYERGVHAVACPTFQGGGSAFSKSLGGAPAIGGLILSWGQTEHGTMRDFNLEFRAYFEREQPKEIETQ